MTDDEADANVRPFPKFLHEWRELNGDHFVPINYINHKDSIEVVLAAQWLFCPNFFNYRGIVFASDFDEVSEADKERLDEWFTHFGGDIAKTEFKGNLTILPDVFMGSDLEPYAEDLSYLAQTIARCWRGLLTLQFPDREFHVEVFDDPNEPYDPQITFYSVPEGRTAATGR